MDASSNSGGREARIPDLTFPVLVGRARAPKLPASPGEVLQVIELSEALLPQVTGRPDSEARRLETKTRVPFRLLDEG